MRTLAPELVWDRNVLELGSGTGFLGILTASIQVLYAEDGADPALPQIYLTDVDEEVLRRCANNVLLDCSQHRSLMKPAKKFHSITR